MRSLWYLSLALNAAAILATVRRDCFWWRLWASFYLISNVCLAWLDHIHTSAYMPTWETLLMADAGLRLLVVAKSKPAAKFWPRALISVAATLILWEAMRWPALWYEYLLFLAGAVNLAAGLWCSRSDRILTAYLLLCAILLYATPVYIAKIGSAFVLLDCLAFGAWTVQGMRAELTRGT